MSLFCHHLLDGVGQHGPGGGGEEATDIGRWSEPGLLGASLLLGPLLSPFLLRGSLNLETTLFDLSSTSAVVIPNLKPIRADESRTKVYLVGSAAVMRSDWAEVSVLHFMKADFQHPISPTAKTSTEH